MWTFQAMGTEVSVATPMLAAADEREVASRVAALFAETERRFSRFRADSELAALNRARGTFHASAELLELLDAAAHHVVATGGLFDPTIGAALCAAGYDRSFATGVLDRPRAMPAPPLARFAELAIDAGAGSVVRPPHVHLDFGGFLKGRTVDRAAALAPPTAMIDAGGDALLRGDGPDGEGWLVEIEDPADPDHTLLAVRVHDRAVATSGTNRRRWRRGDELAHHLIDPRTAEPARSDLVQVTVVAATTERADVLAKVVLLLGREAGAHWLALQGDAQGVLVGGDVQIVGDLEVHHA